MSNGGNKELKRSLTLFPSVMLVVTCIIGSGIFTVPGKVMAVAQGSGPNIMAWVIAGVACLMMSMVYMELAPAFPRAGGGYQYLKMAYGEKVSFFFAWNTMINHVSIIAMLSLAFTNYLKYFFPVDMFWCKVIATGVVMTVAVTNMKGVRLGSIVINTFTIGKMVALGLVIAGGVFAVKGANFKPVTSEALGWSTTFKAAVPAIFAFGGYNQFAYMSAEVKDPGRNIPRAIFIGMLIVITFNILISIICTGTLSVSELANTDSALVTAGAKIFGSAGAAVIGVGALLSIFGTINGSLMAMPRVLYTLSKDNLFPELFSRVNKEGGTPYAAVGLYGILSVILLWSGTFGTLLFMGTFIGRMLEIIVASSLYVLRKKQPEAERPIKMIGYPFTLIIVIGLTIMLASLVPVKQIMWALILAVTCIPGYFIFGLTSKRKALARSSGEGK